MRLTCSMAAAVLSMLAGCSSAPAEPSFDDHADFDYLELCFFECPWRPHEIDTPFATGARGVLWVPNAHRLPSFTVASSDDAVISFTLAAELPFIEAVAHAAGEARLILLDLDGEEIDALSVEVHDVAGFALIDYEDTDRFLLMRRGRMVLRLDPLDSEGRRLFGFGSAEYATDGALALSSVADTAPAIGTDAAFQYNSPEQVDMIADDMLGVSTVEARSGDAALALDVEVVDESAVSSVVVVDHPPFGGGRSAIARAYDATGEEIHSPDCEWEIYPEELRLDWRIDMSRSGVRVDDSLPEIITATCTINGVSSSISL